MSKDLNRVTLVGRLVRDPEVRYTPNGTPVARISIANGERFKQNNEWKDYANYFDVVIWGNQAVNCEKYLKKGSQVAIDGTLRQNRWTDAGTNQTRSRVEIIAQSVQFLSSAGSSSGSGQTQGQGGGFSGDREQTQPKSGFIQDPWGDSGFSSSQEGEESFGGQYDSDDDIPF